MSVTATCRPQPSTPFTATPTYDRSRPADWPELPALATSSLRVPVAGGGHVDYVNADHGASTPALRLVEEAVARAGATYSSVHRGQGWASQVTSAHYEAARAEIGRFVGARAEDVVVITRNTTDALNLLARSLPADAHVVVFATEHHATLLPWPAERTVRLPVPHSAAEAHRLLGDALRGLPREAPRLVVLTGASNVTGELWDLATLVPLATAHGARVALDAAQLAPHRAIDLQRLGVDWVALSGHKLYAPYGAGALVGRRDWLDAAQPYLSGGGATAAVRTDEVEWAGGAARHEAGSPNVLGAVALAAACATIARHREAVEAHEQSLAERLSSGLRRIPGVRTYSLFGAGSERAAVACLTVDGLDSALVSAALSAEYGIGVRDGKFCAHLLVDDLLASDPEHHATAVRISLGLGSTLEHVDCLLAALAHLAAYGPNLPWVRTDSGWRAEGAPLAEVPALW